MSKHENHWYLAGSVVDAVARSMRPRAWMVGLWLALFIGFVVASQTGMLESLLRDVDSPLFVPGVTGVLILLALGVVVLLGRARRANARSGYVRALQSPTPDALIQLIERSMKMSRALPDVDALFAQSSAIGFALYGDERDALQVLGTVNWKAKAPLIQAIGLSAESIVVLLCHRDARRALELAREARAMSSASPAIPGSTQTLRYHNTCVAVGEVLLEIESPSSIKALEESAGGDRYPPLQLLASFGLSAAMDRAGNSGRAVELRTFVRKLAPHCAVLQAKPSEFAPSGGQPNQRKEGPVSTSLSSQDAPGGVAQERSAKRKIVKVVGVMVGLWVLLIAMYVVMHTFFAQPK